MNWWQRVKLAIFGYVFLQVEQRKGWASGLPIYVVRCRKHGIFQDYKHGFYRRFRCPDCLKLQP